VTSKEHGSALVISESPAFLRPNVSLLTPASQVRLIGGTSTAQYALARARALLYLTSFVCLPACCVAVWMHNTRENREHSELLSQSYRYYNSRSRS
jgi:hypothetical protein